jgi:cytochrome d ubiquinol oxidase subunit II
VSLTAFVMQGAAYMLTKVNGEHRDRLRVWTQRSWLAFVALYAAATGWAIVVAPYGFDDILANAAFWPFALLLAVSLVTVPVAVQRRRDGLTFLASSGTIVGVVALPAVGLFPTLVPASTDTVYGLTAYNASSSPHTLTVMLYIAAVGMPIVLAYTAYVYRVFKGKVVIGEGSY